MSYPEQYDEPVGECMIPEGGKLQALILDLSHLGDLPLPRWVDMERVYQVVYMERYEEDESILLWQANREKTIAISRIHPATECMREILIQAAVFLNLDISLIGFVTTDKDLLDAAQYFPCMTLSFGGELSLSEARSIPDYYAQDLTLLYDALLSESTYLMGEGYIRSRTCARIPLRTSIDSYGYKVPLYFCGRYFSREHFLNRLDAYTEGIRRLMAGEGLTEPLKATLIDAIPYIRRHHQVDAVVAVPPKPGEEAKLGELMTLIERTYALEDLSGAFRCKKAYPSLFGLSKKERYLAVEDAFEADYGVVKNKTILVIDDVVATGATFAECFQALKTISKNNICLLSLAVAQSPKTNLWR